MDPNSKSSEQVISEMVEMGFERFKILEAIKVVGTSIPNVVEHIFNTSSCSNPEPPTTHISKSCSSNGKILKKRTLSSSVQVPKSRTINHYFQSTDRAAEKKKNVVVVDDDDDEEEEYKKHLPQMEFDIDSDITSDWEQRASTLLQKHFGFSSLKSFQKEALSAWFAHRDCLVLAATGSGFVLYLNLFME